MRTTFCSLILLLLFLSLLLSNLIKDGIANQEHWFLCDLWVFFKIMSSESVLMRGFDNGCTSCVALCYTGSRHQQWITEHFVCRACLHCSPLPYTTLACHATYHSSNFVIYSQPEAKLRKIRREEKYIICQSCSPYQVFFSLVCFGDMTIAQSL